MYSTYLKYTIRYQSNFQYQVEPLRSETDIRDLKTSLIVETEIHHEMDPTHHMVLKGDLQDLLQMYMLMEEHERYIMKMYQTPVESYRTDLTPLL